MFRSGPSDPTIRFECEPEQFGVFPEPFPASKNLPDWFKKLPGFIHTHGPTEFPGETIKHCMPVLDAFSAGYIIPLPVPARVVVSGGDTHVTWRGGPPLVESHSDAQHEGSGWGGALKWLNPWTITTPPGYSVLITSPFNHTQPFKCLTGIVDTDKYTNRVNFPFVWEGPEEFDEILPAGTPLVQVIPFKRENWGMEVAPETPETALSVRRIALSVQSRVHGYRDLYRTQKHWRASGS